MLNFAYPFANFFQPGIFWADLADFKPLQVIACLALLATLRSHAVYSRLGALRHPAVLAMLGFLFIQCISVYRSGASAIVSEFGFWMVYALFVLVSLRLISDEPALHNYVRGMVCGSIWIVGWGIWAVLKGIETENGGRAGAYGMYENHNDYTFIVVQVLPFVYVYWRSAIGFWKRKALLAATVACVIGVFFSLSRGGMIALVLEFALIVIFTMTPRARWYLLPLVAALGGAAISYQYLKRAENQGDSYTAEDAETSRQELWRAGGQMIKEHPVLGIGSRTFGEHATEYTEISHDNLGKNAHNTFIEVAATSGLVGLFLYLRMIWSALRDLRQAAPPGTSEWMIRTRQAALIALLTECFRAMFDAKSWDWSMFVLVVIAVTSGELMRARAASTAHLRTGPLDPGSDPAVTGLPPTHDLPPTNHLPSLRPPQQGGPLPAANPVPATHHLPPTNHLPPDVRRVPH